MTAREPGRLIMQDDITKEEANQIAHILSKKAGGNYFIMLASFLDEDFIPFIDIFQGDSFTIPQMSMLIRILQNLRIYNDSMKLSPDKMKAKYGKDEEKLSKIIKCVSQDLEGYGAYND